MTHSSEHRSPSQPLASALVDEVRFRLLEESIPRLRKCLDKLSEEEIWYRPNDQTVSVGNLVLHLCGNVRQWLISGLGGHPDHRIRQKEFEEPGPLPTTHLIGMLDLLVMDISKVLDKLPTSNLLEKHTIQGFEVSGVSILIHVVEHFSYHVGQVTYMVKSRKAVDMEYYKSKDLDQRNDNIGPGE